jgi:hypothetical protein
MNSKILVKSFFLFALFFSSSFLFSQKEKEESLPKNYEGYKFVKPGDTLHVELGEITLLPKPNFGDRKDIRFYLWLRRKVFKSYPYARIASARLDSLNSRLEKIKSNRKKRKYIKQIQNYVEGEFTDQIKKMTKTEGRILIKLVHRQTGKTVYDNIKEYRSGWKAFWYNSTANIFKLSLKDEYHPESVNEDFLIEDILQRAFQDDKLEPQDSKLTFDYLKIASENNLKIDVEEYKVFFANLKEKRKKKKKS